MSAACQTLTVTGDSEEASGKWCSLLYLMGYHQLLHRYIRIATALQKSWKILHMKSGQCATDNTSMNTVIPPHWHNRELTSFSRFL